MKQILSCLILPILFLVAINTEASNCVCKARTESKTYQGYSAHFWGTKRAWSCIYECLSSQGAVDITGYHNEWYLGKDDGREGVCDGVSFVNRYNNYIMDFIWIPQEPQQFDPLASTAKNLKQWADETCR